MKNLKCKMQSHISKLKTFLILSFGFALCISSFALAAEAKEYDGIWFLGYNLKSEVLGNTNVRQAISETLDKTYIVQKIVSDEVVPESMIPPSMIGYNAELEPGLQNISQAKTLMKKAGFNMTDKRLKALSLLHTDGVKTVAIAKEIQKDLQKIGIKINLSQIDYMSQEAWIGELTSGKHDFFLMGYKAGIEEFLSSPEASGVDSYSLVKPLFGSNGSANFTGFSNEKVDKLLDQLSGINFALKAERHAKLKEINNILVKERPVEVLFYIEKL